MSGVYIKGMTAPRSCAECLDIGWNYVFECNLDDVESGEKRADCPLLTVPDHGRLIDADALIREHALTKFDWSDAVDVDDIKAAPTIIPASEEGKG